MGTTVKRRKCSGCGELGHRITTCPTAGKKAGKKRPRSWMKTADEVLDQAEERATAQSEPEPEPLPKGPAVELPPISLGDFAPAPEIGEEAGSDPQPEGEAPADEVGAKREEKQAQDAHAKKVANDQLVEMGAGMWCSLLAEGSKYAEARGGVGLGDMFIKMNHKAATILLAKMLEDADVDEQQFAAAVCAGSGAFVGWQCYGAYTREKKAQKQAEGVKPDGKSVQPSVSSADGGRDAGTVVNGSPAGAQPAEGLIVRDSASKAARGFA